MNILLDKHNRTACMQFQDTIDKIFLLWCVCDWERVMSLSFFRSWHKKPVFIQHNWIKNLEQCRMHQIFKIRNNF